MNDFISQIQSDETQAASDYADYQRYLDGEYEADFDAANAELAQVAIEEATHDENGAYIWSDEAIEFEDDFDYEDVYDGQPDEAQEWHDFDPDC